MRFLNPITIIAILIAVSIHEFAHAAVATRLGDPTPRHAGRLSVNPLAHLDLLGILLFLTVGFGWAKPVPVNPSYFKSPRRDTCLTAIAGPVSNLVLAIIALIGLRAVGAETGTSAWLFVQMTAGGSVFHAFLVQLLGASVFVNLGLMAFNLLPIAPLDGSKVLEVFIPYHSSHRYEEFMRMGPYILLALIVGEMLLNIPLLSVWVMTVIGWTLTGLQAVGLV